MAGTRYTGGLGTGFMRVLDCTPALHLIPSTNTRPLITGYRHPTMTPIWTCLRGHLKLPVETGVLVMTPLTWHTTSRSPTVSRYDTMSHYSHMTYNMTLSLTPSLILHCRWRWTRRIRNLYCV